MRICIEKSTGKLIESQGGGEVERLSQNDNISDEEYVGYIETCDILEINRLNTLKQNAINMGYNKADVEVKFVTDEEYQILLKTLPFLELTEEQFNEKKIKYRIRKIAIDSLKMDGGLPLDYKDKIIN